MTPRITECIAAYNSRLEPGEPLMTQRRLAAALGVTESAVSLWVSGKRAVSLATLGRIALALNCSVGDLLAPSGSQHVNHGHAA